MSRTLELLGGLILVGIGLLLLASDVIARWIGGLGISGDWLDWWPSLLIGLSFFFLVPAALGSHAQRRLRAGMVIPGALLAGVGSALLLSSTSGDWRAWSYLWTSIPLSLGVGMYAAGWIADAPAFKWIGSGIAGGALVAYLVFATAFGGEAFRLVGGLGVMALGLALMVGGLAQRLSRKSPPA